MTYLTKIEVTSMAVSRAKFQDMFTNRWKGVLKEYTKLWLSEKTGQKDYWSHEVSRLVKRVCELLDDTVKTKGRWDLWSAASEVYLDTHGEDQKLNEGFNEYLVYPDISISNRKKARDHWIKNRPSSEDLSLEIIERFFPPELKKKMFAAISAKK